MGYWLMFITALGLSIFHFAADLPRLALVGDTVIQGALNRAAKAAAQEFVADRLAGGDPVIDPTRAITVAVQHLAAEWHLHPVTLWPEPGSPLTARPRIEVVTYNGPAFPYVYDLSPGVNVTLTYPGVVIVVEGKIGVIVPLHTGQKEVGLNRYAVGMWVPRRKP